MKFFTKSLQVLLLVVLTQQISISQTCPTIDAQAGTGASTTICFGQCANLTATVVPVRSTSSYSVGSITYSPFAFSGGTAAIGNIDDLWSPVINIGFNFCYFGNTFSQLLVGSNGEITFDVSRANGAEDFSTNNVLPNLTEHPGNTICVAYRDIDPSSGGSSSVFTYTTGVAPCRKFVAYWSAIPTYSCTSQLATFQVVLHEGTNIIETYVSSSSACAAWQSGRGLMGIQNSTGTTAVAPSTRNVLTSWTATNEAWRYVPTGANTFTVDWSGPSGFTATGLTAAPCPTATSNYTATMNVSDCAGTITSYSSTVQVSVTPTPTTAIVATSTVICRGSSSVLSATGATTYSWMPGGATTSSITVSPTVTTTYTLTRTNGSCSSTQTISLVVNANPTVTAVSNPTVLCTNNSATLTSTGATTYTWNPGALVGNTVVVSPTVTTQYTVTGANAAGCTATRTVNLLVSATPTVTAAASSTTACSGSSVTLTSSGASSYTWTPGSLTGATVVVTPTVNTTYTVTARNAAGCAGTNTVNVTVSAGITFTTAASSATICAGATSTLTATGATTYTWLPGSLTGSVVPVSPLSTTIYTVTGSNGGACTATKFVTVTVSVPNITATRTPTAICVGSTATLTAAGGLTYTWVPGGIIGTPAVVSPTATTVYTVTGTNTFGCTNTRTVSLSVLANPSASISATSSTLCPGLSSTLTASGGTSYTWTPGSFTTTAIVVTPSTSSTYTVRVRNASGCTATNTINITVNPSVTVSPVSSPTIICAGNSSTLTATGALTYTWNPGALTGSNVAVSPTLTTTYSVTGTDMNGCNGTATLSVNVSTLNITATSNPTILCSSNTATLTGTGASTYTWNPGGITGSTAIVTPTATTIYTVTGTNTLGCTASQTLNLSVGTTPTVTAGSSSSTVCAGTTLTLSSSGASTYTWLPGSLTGSVVTVSPSSSTTYTVNGQNAAGCIATNTVFVFVNPVPTVTTSNTPLILCSGSTGTLNASGASTYTWNPGNLSGATVTVSPLVTTVYTVVGTSSLNCTGSSTVNLKVTATPTIGVSSSPTIICAGSSATLSGTGAISYTWNPGALTGSSVTVTPSITTTYTLTGDNGFGCLSTNTVVLTVNSSPTITAGASPTIICSGSNATLTASGGSTYTWTPGVLTGSNVAVSPTITTTYTVTGTNAFGCTATRTINVSVSTPTLTATASPTAICSGNSSTLTSTGASTYTWNPGALTGTSVSVSPTVTTVYTVAATTTLGCSATRTINLVVNSTPTVTASSPTTSICSASSVTLTGNGATSYTWNPGALTGTNVIVTPTITTTYTVTGATAICSSTNTITINVTTTPTVTASSSPTTICSGSNATLTANGASAYTWNPGALTGSVVAVTPTTTTIYTVTGTNSFCTNTRTVSVTVNSTTIIASSSPTVVCAGNSATLTANGAFTYTWNPGAFTGSIVAVTPTATTIYTVTGTSLAGCISTQTVSLIMSSNPTVTASSSATNICSTSSATLTGNGATSYTWNPGALTGTNVVVTPTITTTYTVTGANASNCSSTNTITINVSTNPTLTASASPTVICAGSNSTLTASGSAISYTWNPGALTGTTTVVTPTASITYTVAGENALGCISTQTVLLTVNAVPSVTATSNPTIICSGGSSTLTAGGASTYTWTPGALTGSSVTVTPTVTTIYSVTGTNAFGCVNTATVSLITGTTPTVGATASSTIICAGSTTTLTGSGASSYTWNPGALTGTNVVVTPVVNTTYTVTGDNGGCTASQTITINVNAAPSLSVTSTPTVLCSAGSVTLTASGASTYTWNPTSATTASIVDSPTITTTYTVTGADMIGCTSTQTLTVSVGIPVISAVSNPTILCIGNTATLTAGGATSYTWNPGALTGTNVVVTPTITTTYTVDGSNGTCAGTQTITLVVSNPTVGATASSNTICAGATTTLTGSGATSYTWNPGSLTGNSVAVSPSATTTYTVTGLNVSGCSATNTITIDVNAIPSVSVTASSPTICSGSSATLTASGASTYTWNPGSLTGTAVSVTPSVTTTYSITGTSSFGCISTQTVLLNVNPIPTITATSSPSLICSGGGATLTANGATSYTWNPGALTGSNVAVSPTVTTTYTVDGDNGLCTGAQTITLVVSSTPIVSVTASSNTICAGTTGTLTASGATSYTWNPGTLIGTNVAVTPTVTTTYTVNGNNGVGCIASETITINVNAAPSLSIATTATALCTTGPVTLTASGASTYTWNPTAATTTSIVDTPTLTTTYTVTGTDAIGCSNTETITVNIGAPVITLVSTPTVLCVGGTATLTASGASTYIWSPLAISGATITDSPATTTTYTVTGDNGTCTGTETITLVVSTPTITVTASSNTICAGTTATLTAGSAASYTWNPGALTGTNVAVSPTVTTTYTVDGDNGFGCIASETITINVNAAPSLSIAATPTILCSAGSITLTASGASTYTWNPTAATTASITDTPTLTTTYTVTGTDAIGCSNTETLTVSVGNPSLTLTSSSAGICTGGTATLTASGATSYTWNPGALTGTNVAVSPTITTTYTVDGDNGSCTGTQTITLVVSSPPTVALTASSNTICAGATATLTASGAISYTWNPGALTGTNVAVSPISNTTYTVDGDNGFGCIASETITLNVNAAPSLSIVTTATALCTPGSVTLTASGASTYTWNPTSLTTASIVDTPTLTTTYTVTGEDAIGCSNTETLTVSIGAPVITLASTSTVLCVGGTATLTASGATSYTWNPGALTGTNVAVTPTATTTYTVDGDNGTCTGTQTITLVVSPSATIIPSSLFSTICSGVLDTLSATGATSYTWNPGALTGSVVAVTPTITTTYTVDGDNGSGCISTETITINVNTAPSLSITATPTVLCAAGSVTLTASGANTYTWNPTALTTASIVDTPTLTTTYTVSGTDAIGCSNTETITINVGPPVITITSSPAALCIGGTATLTATGATSYTWSPLAVSGNTITDSPATTTTYTVTGDNGSCIGTQTITLVVSPSATIIPSSTSNTICAGTSATLSATGATSYTWNPGVLTGTNVAVTPSVTTTYTVDGDNGLGCISSETITINVNALPSLSIAATPTVLCTAGSVTLTASGASTYTWNPTAAATASIVDTPTLTTTYTVTGEDAIGCSNTQTITISVGNPTVIIVATPTLLCTGSTANLTASGASTYTWNPGTLTGSSIAVTPTTTTTYTVDADNGFGCITTSTVDITVTNGPVITAASNPTTVCSGLSTTLTANGATTYTWMPISVSGGTVITTPTISTTYTVSGDNGGCVANTTVFVNVTPGPLNVTATTNGTITCNTPTISLTGNSTSTGVNYTWIGPASYTSAVQSPTDIITPGDYTLSVTDPLSGCLTTSSTTVLSNTVAPDVTATASASLGCNGSVTLTATSTSTNTLNYSWSGPSSFTASVQSPTTNIAGDYTITLSDALTGCSATTTVTVMSNTAIPVVGIASPGPVLGCNTTVTLSVITAPTSTLTFDWSGPSSFTSSVQSPTTSVPGDYTITVTDLGNGCQNTNVVTVGVSTLVPAYTATIIPATCTGSLTNNDGTILISGNSSTDTYDISEASTYTGTATYSTGSVIPFSGILTNTLVNPGSATPYTIRVFSPNGCFADMTLTLTATTCSTTVINTSLGIAKAVSTPTMIDNNTYNVTYTIVATNTSTVDLTNVHITDDLNTTFPLPTTFSVISAPVITSINSGLNAMNVYDGNTITELLGIPPSTLTAGKTDTIVFTVQIHPNGFFGPFNNSAVGIGTDNNGVQHSDSSNTGFLPDPDSDGNPTNNNIPTSFSITPHTAIGVAKSGTVSGVLADKTLDVTYVITVKNLGNDTIKFVQVLDSLVIPSPALFTIKSGPVTSGSLIANSNYNGHSDIGLLVANGSKLAPGASETITFILNITPNELRSIKNTAIGAGFGADGGIVRDSSDAGSDPDPNGNSDATEQGENDPTILELPDVNLFVPEVFTPDGDGKNDFFVIKGIEGRVVSLTVFNRWGNKVYQSDAYDNTWNGTPNASGLIIGNNKLPQGTYYYIVEFEDGVDKTINGYVVLQY